MSEPPVICYLARTMALGIRKISFFSITLSAIVTWIGFYAWRIMFNNYAVEVFDVSATEIGLIQAAREIPGLLAFGVGALALYLTESRIAALSIFVLGLGLILCGLSPSILMLGLATVLMSFGFHYFEPANMSQLLNISKSRELGKTQGRLQSWESAAGLIGAGLVLSMTLILHYRAVFCIIGAGVAVVGLYLTVALPANRGKAARRKVKIKRKYWLYYTLAFLRGCRRHIFTTFAIFLLVKNQGLNITSVSIVMLSTTAVTVVTNRLLGRLSDRVGERAILAGSSLLLVFIFAGYAFVEYLPVLIAFFVIDNVLFGSSIALKSYVTKIADPEDLTSCLSFGMTANHIIAIVIPVVGGILWSMFGYRTTFLVGAVIVLIDMFFALRVPTCTADVRD